MTCLSSPPHQPSINNCIGFVPTMSIHKPDTILEMNPETMAAEDSNVQILHDLEALSELLSVPHARSTARRTASLSLVRTEVTRFSSAEDTAEYRKVTVNPKSQSRRMSLSLWQPRRKVDDLTKDDQTKTSVDNEVSLEKRGIWNWKPMRALSHIGMQKLTCLFSVEVDGIRSLSNILDGLRLSVRVKKKESRDGSVQTMPSRVAKGEAVFEETMFMRCHVYFTRGSGSRMKFEPRPFLIYVVAVDAEGLDFGTNCVDLSILIQESMERSFEAGKPVCQWSRTFNLSGKAKGGELGLKLAFQIIEKDGGKGLHRLQKSGKSRFPLLSIARAQTRASFSIPSSRLSSSLAESKKGEASDLQHMDEPDLCDFNVEDKGIEQEQSVVKEVPQNPQPSEETGSQTLDADEDKVARDFLQKLDDRREAKIEIGINEKECNNMQEKVYVPDLGKGLGCVIQTRDGGYLAAANPFETPVVKEDMPKLALQMSKPYVIQANKPGFELFRRMAAVGFDELTTEISSLMPLDELSGKSAEQIAFEGIASAVIQGRKKEGASSSAARIIAAVKAVATAMNSGREERALTGIWNANEELLTVDEILATSMHKIETMAIDALKIQADIPGEDAPFAVSPADEKIVAANGKVYDHPLASAIPVEDWIKDNCMGNPNESMESETITISVVVQLRDPSRQHEPIGGPMIALIHATGVATKFEGHTTEKRYKVQNLQVGGIKVRTSRTKNTWDAEKQKLTALQWLVAHGIGKPTKKVRVMVPVGPDLLWSISSRVMADTWLKSMRNPDVKLIK